MASKLSHRIRLKRATNPEFLYRVRIRTGFCPNSTDTAYPNGVRLGYAIPRSDMPYPVKPDMGGLAGSKKRCFFIIEGAFAHCFSPIKEDFSGEGIKPMALVFICDSW